MDRDSRSDSEIANSIPIETHSQKIIARYNPEKCMAAISIRERAKRDAELETKMEEFVTKVTGSADEIVASAKREALKMLLKKDLPCGKKIGYLSKTEAFDYSKKLVALAHMLNCAAPGLRDDVGKSSRNVK